MTEVPQRGDQDAQRHGPPSARAMGAAPLKPLLEPVDLDLCRIRR